MKILKTLTILLAFGGAAAFANEVTIGTASGLPGAEFTIPVTMDSNAAGGASLDIDISFDPARVGLRAGGVGACGFLERGANLAADKHGLTCSTPLGPGVIRVLVTTGPALDNPPVVAIPVGEMFRIRFEILPEAAPGAFDVEAVSTSVGDTAGNVIGGHTFNNGRITVQAAPAVLSFNPAAGSTLALGSVALGGTSPAQTVEVCNVGGTGSEITNIVATISGSTAFSADGSGCAGPLVGATGCCEVDVTFSPVAMGSASGTLQITTSAGNGSFPLTATGTAGPAANLTINPSSGNFGGVDVGATGVITFTIENTGAAGSQASITSFGIGGTFSVTGGSCQPGTTNLGPGGSCTVEVTFSPTAPGAQSGNLTVNGTDTVNGTSLQLSAQLQGVGNGPIFASNPVPGNLNLGFAGAAGGELSTEITVTNTGNENLVLNCSLGNNADNVFSFTGPTGVEADGSGIIAVSCVIPDLASYTAILSCETNDPTQETVNWNLSCSGLEPIPVPTMQTWGLILFALLMLLVGGITMRSFRV